ncbi:uncharacterized protein LOC143209117 [Lasioglossum baleicum]|uniref:uncharacterized protein LOC143209117 n=1 Tax=Lasioglossum baleicum TaxID=434251 RepID=UPI003FCD938B
MQERLSVGNVKLLHAGGGLPHVHYFPTKGDEPNLIKDENDPAKKSYMRSVVCSKTSLLVLLLLIVALTSYLVFGIPRQEDDGIEKISVTERLLTNHGGSIKYQSIAHREKNADTDAFPTEEELSENATNVVNEKQADDSINDSISKDDGRVPTEDEAEEVANDVHLDPHKLVIGWLDESNLNSNSSEQEEFDLMKQPPMDSKEKAMAFLTLLMEIMKDRHDLITELEELFPDETYPAYNDDYDDDYEEDTFSRIFPGASKRLIRKDLRRINK